LLVFIIDFYLRCFSCPSSKCKWWFGWRNQQLIG